MFTSNIVILKPLRKTLQNYPRLQKQHLACVLCLSRAVFLFFFAKLEHEHIY